MYLVLFKRTRMYAWGDEWIWRVLLQDSGQVVQGYAADCKVLLLQQSCWAATSAEQHQIPLFHILINFLFILLNKYPYILQHNHSFQYNYTNIM